MIQTVFEKINMEQARLNYLEPKIQKYLSSSSEKIDPNNLPAIILLAFAIFDSWDKQDKNFNKDDTLVTQFYPAFDTIISGRQQFLSNMYELGNKFAHNGEVLDNTLVRELKGNVKSTVVRYNALQKLIVAYPEVLTQLSPNYHTKQALIEFLNKGTLLNKLVDEGKITESVEFYIKNYWIFISPDTNDELRNEPKIEENGSRIDPPTNNETIFKLIASIFRKTQEGRTVNEMTDICRFTVLIDKIFDPQATQDENLKNLVNFVASKYKEIGEDSNLEVKEIRIGFFDSHYSDIKIFVHNKITGQTTEIQLQTTQTLKTKKKEEKAGHQQTRKNLRGYFYNKFEAVANELKIQLKEDIKLVKKVEKFLEKDVPESTFVNEIKEFLEMVFEIKNPADPNVKKIINKIFKIETDFKKSEEFRLSLINTRGYYNVNSLIHSVDAASNVYYQLKNQITKEGVVTAGPFKPIGQSSQA